MALRAEDEVRYTAAQIDRCLRDWDADYSLPASVTLVRGATQPSDVRLRGRLRRWYRGRGTVEQVIEAADIALAWERLPPGSLERRVVALRVECRTLTEIARLLRTRTADVVAAYREATAQMARALSGQAEQAA